MIRRERSSDLPSPGRCGHPPRDTRYWKEQLASCLLMTVHPDCRVDGSVRQWLDRWRFSRTDGFFDKVIVHGSQTVTRIRKGLISAMRHQRRSSLHLLRGKSVVVRKIIRRKSIFLAVGKQRTDAMPTPAARRNLPRVWSGLSLHTFVGRRVPAGRLLKFHHRDTEPLRY